MYCRLAFAYAKRKKESMIVDNTRSKLQRRLGVGSEQKRMEMKAHKLRWEIEKKRQME